MSPPPPVQILQLESTDYSTIAKLEARVFDDDPITIYAFGPDRGSTAVLQKRATALANQTRPPIAL
jgi:hypothetical protein